MLIPKPSHSLTVGITQQESSSSSGFIMSQESYAHAMMQVALYDTQSRHFSQIVQLSVLARTMAPGQFLSLVAFLNRSFLKTSLSSEQHNDGNGLVESNNFIPYGKRCFIVLHSLLLNASASQVGCARSSILTAYCRTRT